MSGDPSWPEEFQELGSPEKLNYFGTSGEPREARTARTGGPEDAPAALLARSLRLDDVEVRQLYVDQAQRAIGYQHIDNEILAGVWLARLTRSRRYPAEVSRLIGYEADSAAPFALLEPYRGEPVANVVMHLTPDEQRRFQISLLIGLRWLAEAGIVHCAIGPDTVRWDGQHVQITDFSEATIIGTRRGALPPHSWQLAGPRSSYASDRDDVWAGGMLSFYVVTGSQFTEPDQLIDWPALGYHAADLASGAEGCPNAHEILVDRFHVTDPVPVGVGDDSALDQGRAAFYRIREAKRPDANPPMAQPGPKPPSPPAAPRLAGHLR